MATKPLDQLGELQRAVLEVLWDLEKAAVQDVVDALAPTRELAYTTVLSTLQNLERAGWAKHERRGRAYVYLPAKTRAQAGTTSLRAFIKRAFAGDASLLFQALIEDEKLSQRDLTRLRAMIDARRNPKRREARDE